MKVQYMKVIDGPISSQLEEKNAVLLIVIVCLR